MGNRAERRQRQQKMQRDHEMDQKRSVPLAGGLGRAPDAPGRTSVADLILRRHQFLSAAGSNEVPTLPTSATKGSPAMPTPRVDGKPAGAASPGVSAPIQAVPSNAKVAAPEDPIIQSRQQKDRIWKMAQENQDHYLLVEMEQKGDVKKPWFMFPKHDFQYSEFVMLTPAMAQVLVDHLWSRDEGNRLYKPNLVEAYKRDIDNDRWIPSDESIGINYSFQVYNGQHRLRAIIESGKPQPMYVTWNVLDEAKWVVDSGAKRNLSERLTMVVDPKLGNRTAGFCKAIMRGLGSRVRFTDSEIAEFASKWDSLVQWVSHNLPTARAEVQAAIGKAYLWHGAEKVEDFARRLKEIDFKGDGDPAKALYLALTRAKINRINQSLVAYKKTLAALDALVRDKPLNKVYERDEDIFQWNPGWELPVKPAPRPRPAETPVG